MRSIIAIPVLAVVLLVHVSCSVFQSGRRSGPAEPVVAPQEGYGSLERIPFKEAWYGMYFQDEKVGFSHFIVEPAGVHFKISSESVLRLTAMKKTNEIQMKEKVVVRPDLTLVSFESLVRQDDKDLRVVGRSVGGHFLVDLTVDGEKHTRDYPIEGPLYHSSAISFMPSIKGLSDGRTYSFPVFTPEKQGIQKVEQHITRVKGEPGPEGALWSVKSTYGRSVVNSWLDRQGLTVMERHLEGSLVTMIEDESAARKFREKKNPGKDLALDFGLVNVSKPIPDPGAVKSLKITVSGVDPSMIPDDHRQRVVRPSKSSAKGFHVAVTVEDLSAIAGKRGKPGGGSMEEYAAATQGIQSDHPEIIAQAKKIVSDGDSQTEKVTKLARWTSTNIKHSMKDSFTALSVLRSREGECQSHANLYAALARSRGIPTRVVTGLVFMQDVGFLYHAWAESYVNGWIAVDPTLNQVPADATHIKITTADSPDSAASMLKMVGKVKIDVEDFK